jgi:hypothetical protein
VIAEKEIESAVHWLASSAPSIAAARAEMIFADEYRKSLKAILMSESNEGANNAKEMWAYAHPKYVEHLQEIKRTVLNYEKLRAQREAAVMKLQAWQTMSANYRGIKVV